MMPREYNRSERVAGQIRRELAQLIQQEVKDPEVGFVSLSDVEVTRDLAHAKVFLTALVPEQAAAAVKTLNTNAWEFRRQLAHRVDLRTVPELHFHYDDSVDRGERIDALLRDDNGNQAPDRLP